jgi:ribosomal protein S18 acetylase RimI-like enzyme
MKAVRLDPMTDDEYAGFYERQVEGYAATNVRQGLWSEEESIDRSLKSLESLLPKGLATEDHFIYTARDAAGSDAVGVLWVALRPKLKGHELYIYDIEVDERFRSQGYGRATMNAAAAKARELGAASVGLNVFAFNETARALYLSLGYRDKTHQMSLEL